LTTQFPFPHMELFWVSNFSPGLTSHIHRSWHFLYATNFSLLPLLWTARLVFSKRLWTSCHYKSKGAFLQKAIFVLYRLAWLC
jgi:hypothetical protein